MTTTVKAVRAGFVPSTATDQPVEASVLVARASEGDRGAFAELVRLHQRRVRGLLLRLTDDHVLARRLGEFVRNLRVGVRHREHDGVWRHRLEHLGRHYVADR